MGGKGLIAPPGTPSHNVPAASLAAPEVILPESVGFGTRQREAMRAFGEHGMTIEVLLVEDSPGDVRLTQEAFRDANRSIHLHVASDGVEAMAFLRQEEPYPQAPRPHLILLDLNLPRMDGREVLALIKDDDRLKPSRPSS
jgi:response regulator RpfG family c-di-GMP phosphodiesterase